MLVLEDLLIDNLKIYQDDTLYRFTSDAVILSKFAKCKKGDIVADFCSGSGIVGIHFYALNKHVSHVDLIEIQPELSNISKMSVEYNNLSDKFNVINMPLQELSKEYNAKYSLILCNPPYKKQGSGECSEKDKIAMCKHEITITQDEIIEIASKKLQPLGRLCMCQKVERLVEIITKMKECGLEPKTIQFVVNTSNNPYLVLVEGVKHAKPQLKVLPNFVNEGV